MNGFRADSCHNRGPFVLVSVAARFMVAVFICFFQKFPNFCGQICGLGLKSVSQVKSSHVCAVSTQQ